MGYAEFGSRVRHFVDPSEVREGLECEIAWPLSLADDAQCRDYRSHQSL